jgi:hypothetical protein
MRVCNNCGRTIEDEERACVVSPTEVESRTGYLGFTRELIILCRPCFKVWLEDPPEELPDPAPQPPKETA